MPLESLYMRKITAILAGLISSFLPFSVYAYIGPGLAAGTIGVILGVLGSILLLLFALFWYPIKRLLKMSKNKETIEEENTPNTAETENSPNS